VTLDPADAPKVANRSAAREIRILVESAALDMTWSRFGPHEPGAEPHVHHEHVDGFYVLEGELTFAVGPDGDQVHAGPGTAVLVPPGVVHAFDNANDGTTTWLNFHAPSTGFAAFLRGERPGFDSADPPDDAGLPAADALVAVDTARAELGPLVLEVSITPGERSFALSDGRVVNVLLR
jgi:mannose-6-phosphate isomerase-like protein (cupin superfamily)